MIDYNFNLKSLKSFADELSVPFDRDLLLLENINARLEYCSKMSEESVKQKIQDFKYQELEYLKEMNLQSLGNLIKKINKLGG